MSEEALVTRQGRLKALVIRDDGNRFKRLDDVICVARNEATQLFHVGSDRIDVIKIYGPDPGIGYTVVVKYREASKDGGN